MLSTAIGIIGCIFAIVFLIWSVYKGYHIAYMAVICSLIIIITNRMNVVEAFTDTFISGVSNCGNLMWYFVFGLILSELYGKSGAADSIARIILRIAGKKGTSLKRRRIVGIAAVFVVGVAMLMLGFASNALPFLLLPIVTSIFKECDIPRKFMPGLLLGTAATIGNVLPGTPQSSNQIASSLLGTSGTAALVPGIVAGVVTGVAINVYMYFAINKATLAGEHFDYGPLPQTLGDEEEKKRPNIIVALIPMVFIFVAYNFFGLHLYLCLLCASGLSLLLFWKYYEGGIRQLREWLVPTMTRAGGMLLVAGSFLGFSAVFSVAPAFQVILNGLVKLSSGIAPLFTLLLAMALITFIAGSTPNALSFGLPVFAPLYEGLGVSAAAIHRVSLFACTTLDTLPTNTGILFIMDMCGVKMEDGYKTVGMNTVFCTALGAIVCAIMCMIPGLS